MTLRAKILAILALTLTSLVVVLHTASHHVLMAGYRKLEIADVSQATGRVAAALSDAIAQLDTTATDWATWDDAYDFIHRPNERFRHANLVPQAFASAKLDLLVFQNTKGASVFAATYNPHTGRMAPLSRAMRTACGRHRV